MGIDKTFKNDDALITTTISITRNQQMFLQSIIKSELEKNRSISISELHRRAINLLIDSYISKENNL